MKSKTSHPSNENFTLRTQFPVVLSIVDKTQNFHDKYLNEINFIGSFENRPFAGTISVPEIN